MASKNYSILVGVELETSTIQKQLNEASKNKKISLDSSDIKEASKNVKELGLTFQEANLIMSKSIDIITSMVEQVYELDTALTE